MFEKTRGAQIGIDNVIEDSYIAFSIAQIMKLYQYAVPRYHWDLALNESLVCFVRGWMRS